MMENLEVEWEKLRLTNEEKTNVKLDNDIHEELRSKGEKSLV